MDLKSLLNTVNRDSFIGLSVPLSVPKAGSIIIGSYSPGMGAGHITLPESDLRSAAGLLYTGERFSVAVHGLKKMREVHRLRDLDLDHESVWDTRLMAHLFDPGRDDDHGYRLSTLVQEHVNRDYPYMGERLFAQDYPEFLHQCIAKDAELVFHLVKTLIPETDSDLLRLYQEVELPVSSVLVQMHLDGIAVDQAACAQSLAAARQDLEELESQLAFRSRNLFSGRDTYWFLHDAGVDFADEIGRRFRIDGEDLKELAEDHGLSLRHKS